MKTKIALVLDKSGSMASVKNEAIIGFNEALEEIQKTSEEEFGEVEVTLITFNQNVYVEYHNVPPGSFDLLDHHSYNPHGMTSLYDAVGEAIEIIGDVDGKDEAALIMVVTDGYENSSQKWSQNDLAEKIQQLEDTEKWTFTFMCANLDPKVIEHAFNVAPQNVAAFNADGVGIPLMASSMTSSYNNYMNSRALGATSSKNFYEDSKTNDED